MEHRFIKEFEGKPMKDPRFLKGYLNTTWLTIKDYLHFDCMVFIGNTSEIAEIRGCLNGLDIEENTNFLTAKFKSFLVPAFTMTNKVSPIPIIPTEALDTYLNRGVLPENIIAAYETYLLHEAGHCLDNLQLIKDGIFEERLALDEMEIAAFYQNTKQTNYFDQDKYYLLDVEKRANDIVGLTIDNIKAADRLMGYER